MLLLLLLACAPLAYSHGLCKIMKLLSNEHDLPLQLEEYNDQYTEMIKTFWPKFAESLTPESGAQTPAEVPAWLQLHMPSVPAASLRCMSGSSVDIHVAEHDSLFSQQPLGTPSWMYFYKSGAFCHVHISSACVAGG
jgi:hypothetical protein